MQVQTNFNGIEAEIEQAKKGFANKKPVVIIKDKNPGVVLMITFVVSLFLAAYIQNSNYINQRKDATIYKNNQPKDCSRIFETTQE